MTHDHSSHVHVIYDGLAVPEILVDQEGVTEEEELWDETESDDAIDYDEVAIPEFHALKSKQHRS